MVGCVLRSGPEGIEQLREVGLLVLGIDPFRQFSHELRARKDIPGGRRPERAREGSERADVPELQIDWTRSARLSDGPHAAERVSDHPATLVHAKVENLSSEVLGEGCVQAG